MTSRALLLLLLTACSGGAGEAPAPPAEEAPAAEAPAAEAPVEPVAEKEGLTPFGDPWELCPNVNDFRLASPDGQVTLGFVQVPNAPREGGRFLPGNQYWLRLNANQPLPSNFRIEPLSGTVPQPALDRTDWEQQDNSLFDSQTSDSFQPFTPGPGDVFYEVKVTKGGQSVRAAYLHRDVGGAPAHAWYGETPGLAPEPANPGLLVIKTEDFIRFEAAPQPAAGTSFLKTTDPA